MKPVRLSLILLLCAIAAAFTPFSSKEHWKSLFNGKDLSGWDTYIGPDLDDSGKPITGVPLGLNNDPRHVFTVVPVDGENVIRVSGQNWGANSKIITCGRNSNGGHFRGGKRRERKRIAVYYTTLLENMVPIMAPGCARRSSR